MADTTDRRVPLSAEAIDFRDLSLVRGELVKASELVAGSGKLLPSMRRRKRLSDVHCAAPLREERRPSAARRTRSTIRAS
jgi:hypothetical protein